MDTEVAVDFSNADWNLYAQCYDALLALQPYQELLATVADLLSVQEDDCILDAGCGTGNVLQSLAHRKTGASLAGIDGSEEMLARAKCKCEPLGVKLYKADLNEKLPLRDASFTKVSCTNVLYALRSPQFTLRQLHRICKSEATLVLVTPKRGYNNGLILKQHAQSKKSDEYWKDLHASPGREEELIREAIDDEEVIRKMLLVAKYNRFIAKTAVFHFLTEGDLSTLVTEAGFTITSMQDAYAGQCMLVYARRS